MRFNILGDFDTESKIGEVLHRLSDLEYRKFFQEKEYGNTPLGVTVFLMCQDPALNLKQRIKYDKDENKLYIDLMFDLDVLKELDVDSVEKIVKEKITTEVADIVARHEFPDFNESAFQSDLEKIFGTQKSG